MKLSPTLFLLTILVLKTFGLSDQCIDNHTCCDLAPLFNQCFQCNSQNIIAVNATISPTLVKSVSKCEIALNKTNCFQYQSCTTQSVYCSNLTSYYEQCIDKPSSTPLALPPFLQNIFDDCIFTTCPLPYPWICQEYNTDSTSCFEEYNILFGDDTEHCINATILMPECDALYAFQNSYIVTLETSFCSLTQHTLIIQYILAGANIDDSFVFYVPGNAELSASLIELGWCDAVRNSVNDWYCAQNLALFQSLVCNGYGPLIYGSFCNATSLNTFPNDLVAITVNDNQLGRNNYGYEPNTMAQFIGFQCLGQLRQLTVISDLPSTYYNTLVLALISAPVLNSLRLSNIAFLSYEYTNSILENMPHLRELDFYNVQNSYYLGINETSPLVSLKLNYTTICSMGIPTTLVQLSLTDVYCAEGSPYNIYQVFSLQHLRSLELVRSPLLEEIIAIPDSFCSLDYCSIDNTSLCTNTPGCCAPLQLC